MATSAITLDLRGLKCPLPVLRVQKALRGVASGQGIEVLCTDPLAGIDIPHLVRAKGHRLLSQRCEAAVWTFVIVKA